MPFQDANKIGWSLALAGVVCGVIAAAIKGGSFEAFTAASVGLNGLAAMWGYASKTTPPKA